MASCLIEYSCIPATPDCYGEPVAKRSPYSNMGIQSIVILIVITSALSNWR